MDFSRNYGLLVWCSPSQQTERTHYHYGSNLVSLPCRGHGSGRETIEKFPCCCQLWLYLILKELGFSKGRNVCHPPISQSCWGNKTPTRAVFKHVITGHWIAVDESVPFIPQSLPPTHPGKLAQNGSYSVFFCPVFPGPSLLSVNLVWSLGDVLSYFRCRGQFQVKWLLPLNS